ncbi:MAG: hypothetical protein NZM15_00815 [Flavobacteriales bacterium]|nr:hypothetical protein [Flavobacteriales bacterium]MDW8431224.1 hypothetical protein [Flavobacteriales bacterium]
MRWLSRRLRRRIEAPPWPGKQGSDSDHAGHVSYEGCVEPVLRYAARSAATQGPLFDTACTASLFRDRWVYFYSRPFDAPRWARLLRDRSSIRLSQQAYSGNGGGPGNPPRRSRKARKGRAGLGSGGRTERPAGSSRPARAAPRTPPRTCRRRRMRRPKKNY